MDKTQLEGIKNFGDMCRRNDEEIKDLKIQNQKMMEMLQILWLAPPGQGGPGYQEALNSWNENNK